MSLKTFTTPYDLVPIDRVNITPDDGNGFSLTAAGTYAFQASEEWFYSDTDGLAIEDMTKVDDGDVVTFTIANGDPPIVRYLKARAPRFSSIQVSFAQAGPDGVGLNQSQVDARVAIGVTAAEAYSDGALNSITSAYGPRLLPPGGAPGDTLVKIDGTDYNTGWAAPGGAGNSVQTAMRVTSNSTTGVGGITVDPPNFDDTLTFPVVAGVYVLEADLLVDGGGHALVWFASDVVGASTVYATEASYGDGTNVKDLGGTQIIGAGAIVPFTDMYGGSITYNIPGGVQGRFKLFGKFTASGPGTVSLGYLAQLGGETIGIAAGSLMRVTKVA